MLSRGEIGVVGLTGKRKKRSSRSGLGSPAGEGDSPVSEESGSVSEYLSRAGHVQSCLKPGGPSPKAKYSLETDRGRVL